MVAPMLRVVGGEIKCKVLSVRLSFPLIQRLFLSDWEEDEYAKRVFVGPNKVWPHPETPAKGEFEVSPPKGKVYDKKPFPITLKAGKKYAWCVCGHSKSQPFCDGHHKRVYQQLRGEKAIKFSPHIFTVPEEKQYWLCNCKQTENRPFCDGTHKSNFVQEKKVAFS